MKNLKRKVITVLTAGAMVLCTFAPAFATMWNVVTFDANGGLIDGKATVEETTETDAPTGFQLYKGTEPTPTREGSADGTTTYKFVGWATEKVPDLTTDDTSGITDKLFDKSQFIEKNITVYAAWQEVKKEAPKETVTITYEPNGGERLFPIEYVSKVTLDKGTATFIADCVPDNLGNDNAAFIRDGYTFVNWNTKADGTGTTYESSKNDINKAVVVNDDLTLYAQWKKVEEDIGGGDNPGDNTGDKDTPVINPTNPSPTTPIGEVKDAVSTDTPKTGDSSMMLWASLGLLTAAGASTLVMVKKHNAR